MELYWSQAPDETLWMADVGVLGGVSFVAEVMARTQNLRETQRG